MSDVQITTGNTAQLALAQSQSRSYLFLQNTDSSGMIIDTGSARATCALSSGKVNSVTITNAGFNFTNAPVVRFLGGGSGPPLWAAGIGPSGAPFLGGAQPNYPSPSHPAMGHAVMTGSAPNLSVASVTIDDPGVGYLVAPFVQFINSDLDPYGAALPAVASLPTTGQHGFTLAPGESRVWDATTCFTDPVSVLSPTTGATLIVRWMD